MIHTSLVITKFLNMNNLKINDWFRQKERRFYYKEIIRKCIFVSAENKYEVIGSKQKMVCCKLNVTLTGVHIYWGQVQNYRKQIKMFCYKLNITRTCKTQMHTHIRRGQVRNYRKQKESTAMGTDIRIRCRYTRRYRKQTRKVVLWVEYNRNWHSHLRRQV
jgi:hypothetical protein